MYQFCKIFILLRTKVYKKKNKLIGQTNAGSMFCNQDLFIAYLHTVRILAEYYIIMCLIRIVNHRKILLIHVLGIELEF